MTEYIPELPAAFDLVQYEQINDLRAEAIAIANGGKEEGTILWATSQSNARGRLDQEWICSSGDLHCTIILRPEFSREQYPEMMLVAAVSMANALATHFSAMTGLGFSWPNDINIAKHKVAAVWLDSSSEKTDLNSEIPWLNISVSVNIENSPGDFSMPAMSIKEAQGETDIRSPLLLETYARQFITQINNWSERGMGYICKQWKFRAEDLGQEITVKLAHSSVTGILEDIGNNGEIRIKLPDKTHQIVSLAECLIVNGKI